MSSLRTSIAFDKEALKLMENEHRITELIEEKMSKIEKIAVD